MELTRQERKESIALFKELFKKAYQEKHLIGLAEHMIYNVIRNVDPNRGIKKIKPENIMFAYYDMYYAQSWYYLPTHSKVSDFHIRLSKILGDKYERILRTLPNEVSKLR